MVLDITWAFKHIWVNKQLSCEMVVVIRVGAYGFRRLRTTLLRMCSHGAQSNLHTFASVSGSFKLYLADAGLFVCSDLFWGLEDLIPPTQF